MSKLKILIPITLILTACVESTSVVKQESPPPAKIASCDNVAKLNQQAYGFSQQGKQELAQQALETAIKNCPNSANSYNNLAEIYLAKGKPDKAIEYYRKALAINPNLSEAWNGLGEIYYKKGQFPLSLEAHLHACKTDEDSKERVKILLENNRYTVTEEGEILDKESLLLLYNKQRRKAIDDMIADCGLRGLSRMEKPTVVFRNFQFDTGKATLKSGNEAQLEALAAALINLQNKTVKIYGHTDNQPFPNTTPNESRRLNQELSLKRANTVAEQLSSRGVPSNRLITKGIGQDDPLIEGNSAAAWAKNRRVEIEVD
jgi:outer membrane protein OmpA-like peptidoglycan-associated protein